MKKIKLYMVLAVLCVFQSAFAQNKAHSIYLKVGDKMPDVAIVNIINGIIKPPMNW